MRMNKGLFQSAATVPSATNIAAAAAAPRARSLPEADIVIRIAYTTSMGLQDKFRLFGALRAGADGLFAVLMFIFVLAGAAVSSPALASPIPAASYGAYEQADLSETSVPRSAVQRASQPSECVE